MNTNYTYGINHIEFWVKSVEESMNYYDPILNMIGWYRLNDHALSTGSTEIYFQEREMKYTDSLGPRHFCFQALSRQEVDAVAEFMRNNYPELIIRGPLEVNEYSEGYYTIDFRDINGFVIEVAFTPNMKM